MEHAQEQRRFDVVVICERDDRVQLAGFDLPALQLEGFARPERRGPPGGLVVEFAAVQPAVARFVAPQRPGHGRAGGGEAGDEVQGLL